MVKFPADVPKKRVITALAQLGFRIVREYEHIFLIRDNDDEADAVDHAQSSTHLRFDVANHLYTSGHLAR